MKKEFKQPDLNAPRFRHKSMNLLTRDLYERFRQRFPEHDAISLQRFKEVVTTFNGKLYEGAIDNRDGVELPEGLGFIFLGSCPPAKTQNIDVVKSAKYGIVAKHQSLKIATYIIQSQSQLLWIQIGSHWKTFLP